MTVSKGHAMLKKALLKLVGATHNEDGIALVTSLMLTLITLTIIVSLLYMVTGGLQRSGANKRYKTALEASYGGANIVMKDFIPLILQNLTLPAATFTTSMQTAYQNQNVNAGAVLVFPSSMSQWQTCLNKKLTTSTQNWGAACSSNSSTLNPTSSPDFQLNLPGTGGTTFTVYSKIVDTVTGNTDISGVNLQGGGVTESSSYIAPQHNPYIYRIEVQAERQQNPLEKSELSVLYGY
jgi:hypothetical protein